MDPLTLIFGILLGLVVLVFLVVIHELGHALVARRNGVVVEEFGIGFPPRAWGKKLKNGVLFSVNWLPLGGFVKMQGESDDSKKKGDYGAASLWAKTKILLAGVLINYIAAAVIFIVLYAIGIPKVLPDQFYVATDSKLSNASLTVGTVSKGSPAEKAGIKVGDTITRIGNMPVDEFSDVTGFTAANAGKTVTITYKHDGGAVTRQVTLRPESEKKQGLLGVGASSRDIQTITSGWSSVPSGIVFTGQVTLATLQGLGELVGNLGHANFQAASESVSGPVGIFGSIFPNALKGGIVWILLTTGLISLSLAIMNTLPIPALDGGRWFVTMIFRVLRKPLPKELEEKIHGTGFLVLIGLILLITVLDVGKLFR
jgi:regulator of sigma E protease